MKILVLSDSHRAQFPMEQAVRKERPDAIVHLGDHCADAELLETKFPTLPICSVRGNCDLYAGDVPEEALFTWEGIRIFAVHGHRYGVKSSLIRLKYAALERQAHVVLYGHTHCPYCETIDKLWIMNPGACNSHDCAYGVVEIKDGVVTCCLKNLYSEV